MITWLPNMCPFEKKEKEVFLNYQLFFQLQKNFVQGTTFVQFFMYCKTKKNSERSEIFWKKKENLKLLRKFSKKNFFGSLQIFFCFTIHKKLNKSCFLDKFFLFLKKKVGSPKNTSFSFFSKGHIFGISILVS